MKYIIISRAPGVKNFCQPILALALAGSPMSAPPAVAASETSVSAGAEYTSGDYGTPDETGMWYFPVTLKHETDVYMMSLIVPYIIVDGSGSVVAGGSARGIFHATAGGVRRTESGIGDIELAASRRARTGGDWRLDLGGRIKFGTADAQDNLSTGENDVSVQLAAEKSREGRSYFGAAGYKILGDPPGIDYDDVFYGSVGLSRRFGAAGDVGMELYAQQAPHAGMEGKSELTVFLSGKPGSGTRLTGYVIAGFADGSPDWGIGIVIKRSRSGNHP